MSKIITIILLLITPHSYSNDFRSVLAVSGGSSTLQTFDQTYRVHYSVGQQGPIGIIKSKLINARQGFIQPPKFIETSLAFNNIMKVKISPNPFTDVLDIVFLEEIKDKIKVKIFDLMGRLVFKDDLPIKSEHNINLNSIKDSQYIIRLDSENKYYQTKIIKRKN